MEKIAEPDLSNSYSHHQVNNIQQQQQQLFNNNNEQQQIRHQTIYNIQGNIGGMTQQAFYPAMVSGQQTGGLRMRPVAFDQTTMYARPISIENLKNSTVQWSTGGAPPTAFFTTPNVQMSSATPQQIDPAQFNAMFYNKQTRATTTFYPSLPDGVRSSYVDASAALRPGQVIIARGHNQAFPIRLSFQQPQHQQLQPQQQLQQQMQPQQQLQQQQHVQQQQLQRDVVRLTAISAAADNSCVNWTNNGQICDNSDALVVQSTDQILLNGKVNIGGSSGVCTSPVSDYETDHPVSSSSVSSPPTRITDPILTGNLMDDSGSRDAPPPSVASITSGQSSVDEPLLPDSSHQPLTLSARKSEKQVGMNAVYDKMVSLGDEPDRAAFLTQLFNFMRVRTTPITAIPIICRQVVDLYKLYHVVKQFGGMMQVTKMKQWRDVSSLMSFGGSSSAGFTLKRNYCRFIFPYECKFDRNDMDPTPIIAAMETTSKKEGSSKKKEKSTDCDSALIPLHCVHG